MNGTFFFFFQYCFEKKQPSLFYGTSGLPQPNLKLRLILATISVNDTTLLTIRTTMSKKWYNFWQAECMLVFSLFLGDHVCAVMIYCVLTRCWLVQQSTNLVTMPSQQKIILYSFLSFSICVLFYLIFEVTRGEQG